MDKGRLVALGLLFLGLSAAGVSGDVAEGAVRAGNTGWDASGENALSGRGLVSSWDGGGPGASAAADLGVAECPAGGNDGFEAGIVDTNEIPCWTVVERGHGSWCNQTGTVPPLGDCAAVGSGAVVPPPPEGSQAAMTEGGTGGHLLYRCGIATSDTLTFQLYVKNGAGSFYSPDSLDHAGGFPNQQFRADLVTEAGMVADPFTLAPADVLLNLYRTLPGHPTESGYSLVAADIGDFVGQTVCLRFAEVDNQLYLNVGVDDVQFGGKNPTGDTDLDGCADLAENGPDETLGGQRDYLSFWDFFDVPAGAELTRNADVTGEDIFAVIGRFNATDEGPGDFDQNSDPLSTPNQLVIGADRANYHPAFDRGALVGPNPWNLGAPDGSVTGAEIFAVIAQFGHSCS